MPSDIPAPVARSSDVVQPIRMSIAALGGEGGGVLTSWIVSVAQSQGWPVQSSSVPGVAQRTGATTYYVEIVPQKWDSPRRPVLALTPTPGFVDVVVATELLEAARSIEQGMVSPDRTTLIASPYRSFTIEEKSDMGDGRIDPERILRAIEELPRRSIPVDFARLAEESNAISSSVVLGAIAGAGVLPVPRAEFEAALRASGIAVDANLRGFAAGYDAVTGAGTDLPADMPPAAKTMPVPDAVQDFPAEVQAVVAHALPRLKVYQGKRYAARYLAMLRRVLAAEKETGTSAQGFGVTRETARYLALMMCYEDIIRVAALKTGRARWTSLYEGAPLGKGDVLRVTEFLKPGVEEVASMLPPWFGRRLVGWAKRRGKLDAYNVGMGVRTTSVFGFLLLRGLASMRFYRPFTYRYALERVAIGEWIDLVVDATRIDAAFGAEVCECARIRKGYGSTHRRGTENFEALMDRVVAPAVAEGRSEAGTLRNLRALALSDPEGEAMMKALEAQFPGTRAGSRPG
ncbi:MAG: indolepyruvate oxidoreductase subunit beta family protein [Roseovarius sp.]